MSRDTCPRCGSSYDFKWYTGNAICSDCVRAEQHEKEEDRRHREREEEDERRHRERLDVDQQRYRGSGWQSSSGSTIPTKSDPDLEDEASSAFLNSILPEDKHDYDLARVPEIVSKLKAKNRNFVDRTGFGGVGAISLFFIAIAKMQASSAFDVIISIVVFCILWFILTIAFDASRYYYVRRNQEARRGAIAKLVNQIAASAMRDSAETKPFVLIGPIQFSRSQLPMLRAMCAGVMVIGILIPGWGGGVVMLIAGMTFAILKGP